nr:hypothetical protein [Tanacetum cinerariifolium]
LPRIMKSVSWSFIRVSHLQLHFGNPIDSLLDEFVSELILLKSIPPGIDEADYDPEKEIHLIKKLLYDNSSPRPSKEINFDAVIESFSPSPIPFEDSDPFMEEIDFFLLLMDQYPQPGHLAARLGGAETKVATWDDLAFKLIILR